MFRGIAVHLQGGYHGLEQKTQELFTSYFSNSTFDAEEFRGVQDDQVDDVQRILQVNIVIYDVLFENGQMIGQLIHRSLNKWEQTELHSL